jgi:signal transduction histidine kinase
MARDVRRSLAALAGTRAFQQAAVFVAAVVLVGALVMWWLLEATNGLVSRQVVATMAAEAEGIAGIAEAAGADAAVAVVNRRARGDEGHVYFLESTTGAKLAGNLDRWPGDMPRAAAAGPPAGGTFDYRPQAGETGLRLAAGVAVTLPGGASLLVGRDLEPQRALAATTRWLFLAGFGGLALAGLLAGLVTSRLSLGRVAAISRTSDEIMAGDLSRRVPLTGSGDELDHLAGNLNAMLDRIESLMAGLREVSDNIAHDLKTPLTRLRARAEAAQRGGPQEHGEGLAHVIEDADELIKTFNALLLIARLEAGALDASAEAFDVAALARDVAELYEPVAEDAGLRLECRPTAEAPIRANRQLIGQAIANLIDNAIKYGRPTSAPEGASDILVTVDAKAGEIRLAVGDHGPGIPAADRERVLKRFVRLEASRTRPGTGLGLSLVSAVARLSGGRLQLEDNAPGLKVVLILPTPRP